MSKQINYYSSSEAVPVISKNKSEEIKNLVLSQKYEQGIISKAKAFLCEYKKIRNLYFKYRKDSVS